MNKIQQIIKLGIARLQQCANGNDFFQSLPAAAPGNDLVQWYLCEFGHIINSDCAKLAFLKDGYNPGDPESVRKFHVLASELVKNLIEVIFQQTGTDQILYLMAGGNGSGKSSFCDGIRSLLDDAWCIDATMGSYLPTEKTIERALTRSMKPVIFWIKRSPEDAWNHGILKCARNGSHVTPRDVFESTHAQVSLNLEKLKRKFPPSALQVIEIENDF